MKPSDIDNTPDVILETLNLEEGLLDFLVPVEVSVPQGGPSAAEILWQPDVAAGQVAWIAQARRHYERNGDRFPVLVVHTFIGRDDKRYCVIERVKTEASEITFGYGLVPAVALAPEREGPDYGEMARSSREGANAFLRHAGILDKDGNLRPEYGGDGEAFAEAPVAERAGPWSRGDAILRLREQASLQIEDAIRRGRVQNMRRIDGKRLFGTWYRTANAALGGRTPAQHMVTEARFLELSRLLALQDLVDHLVEQAARP